MHTNLAYAYELEWFWLFIAAQFPFAAFDENVVRAKAGNTMGGCHDKVLFNDCATYLFGKCTALVLSEFRLLRNERFYMCSKPYQWKKCAVQLTT